MQNKILFIVLILLMITLYVFGLYIGLSGFEKNLNAQYFKLKLKHQISKSISLYNYNEKVKTFNKAIKSWPVNMIAGILGFKEKAYLNLDY